MTAAGRRPMLTLCFTLGGGTAIADTPEGAAAVLERAAQFYDAPASKEPGLWRLAWLGTSDLGAVDQARRPGLHLSTRAQDLLVIDPVGRRAALDTQRIGSDGTPGLWRHQTTPESGRSINRKSGLTFDAADRGRHLWERLAWRLPQLAIAEVRAAPERIRALTRAQDREGPVDVVRFELSPGREVEIRIRPSGEVAGYAYVMNRLRGPARVITRFEPSVAAPGIGKVPRGFTVEVGKTRWLALSVLDARRTPLDDDPWLRPPETDTAPRPTIAGSPRRVEALFPGAWALRNIGGYNTFLVDVGGCLLLFDAIASFGNTDVVPPPPPAPLADQVLEAVRTTVPGTPLCWVVPSHHHDDHLGGIVGLARAGATVLTSPGNVALVREVLRDVPGAKVEALRAPRVFDRGPTRLEIRQLEGLHVQEMLFAWFPERRAALTADVTDYLVEEKRFLQLLDREGLQVDTIHAVHSARRHTRAELDADLDFTN
jgi:glyoxylase-like metal-dependent hydrolase (beta-lactamase superfamily II)